MTTTARPYRYQLPAKAVKADCPDCGSRHKKTLSRYVDTKTGEPLPDPYGRCDRESNCGYHLSPYHKTESGLSYHDEQKALDGAGPIPKAWFKMAGGLKRKGHLTRSAVVSQLMDMEGASAEQAERVAAFIFDKTDTAPAGLKPELPIYCIPESVLNQSLSYYERNQFAILLTRYLGPDVAHALLSRFQIGTSSRWPGACIFWYIDAQNRIRGGQIKLFDETFHTVKYIDQKGEKRSKTSWVHSAYARACDERSVPYPAWLVDYLNPQHEVDKSPCLFGLPQLQHAPADAPVAIVEAPKTAVLCSHFFPDFIWLAVGGKSYLNAQRLAPLKGRKVCLFPDLNAYYDLTHENGQVSKGWLSKAQELQTQGFDITVSDYLETQATDEQRSQGLDLADFLLAETASTPERIEESVTDEPTPPPVARRPIKIPRLIQNYWTLFAQPPLPWNRIAAHKALMRCFEPETVEAEAVEVVETIAEWADNPGSVLSPLESKLDRLQTIEIDSYPPEWDQPSPPDAVPTIQEKRPTTGDYRRWQKSPESPFRHLGLNSLPNQVKS